MRQMLNLTVSTTKFFGYNPPNQVIACPTLNATGVPVADIDSKAGVYSSKM